MAGNRVISAVLTLKDKDFGSTAKKSASAMTDFQRKAQHSTNTVRNFGRSATSSFKSVLKGAASITAAIGITRGLSMAFNKVRSSVSSAFDRIDTMERFERTMTTMLGSTDAAKDALSGLSAVVDGTAYGLDTAARSVQDFVSRGVDVKKATGWFDSMGDAVAFFGDGSNEQLESVTTAMSKMLSSGKVSMQQMETLYLAGIDAPGIYAKAVGKNAGQVQKDLSSGKVSAEEFFDVVTTAMSEGTNGVKKIAGTAKEAGATWKGAIGNMQFAIVRGVTTIISALDEMLENNGLPSMREMVTSFGKRFESVLKGSASFIQPFIDSMSGMVETIRPGLDWLKDTALPAVKGELVGMYEASKPGLEWLKDTAFPGIVDAVVFATEGFTGLYNFVKDNLPLITPIVAGVAGAITAFRLGIVAITTAKSIWAGVTTAVTIATGLLNGTLALTPFGWVVLAIGAVVAAGVALYMNWDKVKEGAQSLWDKTKEVFGNIHDWAKEKIMGVVGYFVDLYKKFTDFRDALTSFSPPKWLSTIGGAIGGAASRVGNFISGSHATGLNRVPYDGYIAELHKDEMVVPATQSRNLRQQGLNINNVDKGRPVKAKVTTQRTSSVKSNSIHIAKLADQIIVREEADIDKIATMFVRKLEEVHFNMA